MTFHLNLRHWLFFLFSVLCAQGAFADNFQFLTYEQFSTLSESEQRLYIKEIRSIAYELTNDGSKFSFFSKYFFPEAEAAEPTAMTTEQRRHWMSVQVENVNQELERLDSYVSFGRGYEYGATQLGGKASKELSLESREQIVLRMNQVRPKLKTANDVVTYNRIRNDFAIRYMSDSKQIVPASVEDLSPAARRTSLALGARTKDNVVDKPGAKATTNPAQAATGNQSPNCIYAGFVIKTAGCQPHYSLPDSMKLDEITNPAFKCDNDKQILCNPLLYGYEEVCSVPGGPEKCVMKPICINRSVNASKNCHQLSDKKAILDRVYALWKNPKNKTVYDTFIKDITDLCEPGRSGSDDVIKTCQVVAKRFNDVMAKSFPGPSVQRIKDIPSERGQK